MAARQAADHLDRIFNGAERQWLLIATVLLGSPANFVLAGVLALLHGYLFLTLERDPGDDQEILHITLPPGPWKGPK